LMLLSFRVSVISQKFSNLFVFLLWLCSVLAGFIACPAAAQTNAGFFSGFARRAQATQASEPHWATPLITTTPVLDQSLRADFQHGTQSGNTTLWSLLASKGAKIIVAPRTELDLNPPPYLIHSQQSAKTHVIDGFGDFSWTVKYRLMGRDEHKGNSLLTAWLSGTYPTGSNTNGAAHAVLTPTIGGGKGWGWFDAVSTLSGGFPVDGVAKTGRTISWNTVGQARLSSHWWVELEDNSSFIKGGSKDGQKINYLTPGAVSRWRNGKRRGVTLGTGIELATSRTHTTDHNLVMSARVHF
jgi:hypothetical protein